MTAGNSTKQDGCFLTGLPHPDMIWKRCTLYALNPAKSYLSLHVHCAYRVNRDVCCSVCTASRNIWWWGVFEKIYCATVSVHWPAASYAWNLRWNEHDEKRGYPAAKLCIIENNSESQWALTVSSANSWCDAGVHDHTTSPLIIHLALVNMSGASPAGSAVGSIVSW